MEMILSKGDKDTFMWAVQYMFEKHGVDLDFQYEHLQDEWYKVYFPKNVIPKDIFSLGALFGEVTTIQKYKSITQKS